VRAWIHLESVTPDGVKQAWFVEMGPGSFSDIPSDAEILEAADHPEIEPTARIRMEVTSWSSPVLPPILWGGELGGLVGMRERWNAKRSVN
jgi:hypothetical protein